MTYHFKYTLQKPLGSVLIAYPAEEPSFPLSLAQGELTCHYAVAARISNYCRVPAAMRTALFSGWYEQCLAGHSLP